jgi:hypothetical protein
MPIEKWSDAVTVVHLGDDPQFSDDLDALEPMPGAPAAAGAPSAPVDGLLGAVLDFSSVHVINSSNLAKLLKLRKRLTARGGKMLLCNISTQVWGAFLLTGLDKFFEVSENVTTALATLAMGGVTAESGKSDR